jgi:parvulin-like peptidyl-prolyl isomerase
MSLESDAAREPRDYTRWIWAGIIVASLLALGVLWFVGGRERNVSMVRARHILIQFDKENPEDRAGALERINDLRARIVAGERFGTLAREYSDDPTSARRGGDLGYYRRGKFEGAFEDYVWSAPIGQLSEVVETDNGFHLIMVENRELSKVDRYEQERQQTPQTEEAPAEDEPPAAPAQ